MAAIAGLRSPYDKTIGGLHHLGRMLDKIRLKQADCLPEDFHRNYGLSIGLDGQLCGFLGADFAAIEARVREGGTDAEMAEWIFARWLRPSRMQALVWNEYSCKLGWNDRLSSFLAKQKAESGLEQIVVLFDLIETIEGRIPPAAPRFGRGVGTVSPVNG